MIGTSVVSGSRKPLSPLAVSLRKLDNACANAAMGGELAKPVVLVLTLFLAGCVAERATSPARTATEQLLISTAADRAAEKLAEQIPANIRVLLSTTFIDAPDGEYALLAIKDRLLRRGIVLADDKASADAILEVRAGALSTDEKVTSLGTPQLSLPVIPGVAAYNGFPVPAINLFKKADTKATAKFAATGYDPKTGKLIVATEPQYGYSRKTDWVVLLFFAWTDEDFSQSAPR